MSGAPSAPDIGVLAIVPDCFDEPWQSRHQLLTRLSSRFHVVWVEPARGWREVLRAPRQHGSANTMGSGWHVYAHEAWLPLVYRPAWLGRLLERLRLRRARRILVRCGCTRIVLSLWRPQFAEALNVVSHDLSAYHIDDEYTFSGVGSAPDRGELRLLQAVDVVSVHSPGLLERKGGANPRTVFVPNGVDYAAYARTRPEPLDLATIPRPRIGYTGYIKMQLDWDLIQALVVSHREWHFVFVGPHRPHEGIEEVIATVGRERNAHFLPSKTQHELAAYPQHFDVCVMPYRTDSYTRCIYPLKLHEYLAAGRPVVGSRIRTLEDFADVVTLADSVSDWSAAITEALDPAAQADSRRLARQAVAREHDWDLLAERVAHAISAGLDATARRRPD